jgi:cyanophycinase
VSLRAFGLLGSGEFQPWTVEFDQWLLNRADGDGTVAIAPTASAPEGGEVFERWGRTGVEHFAERGIEAVVLPLRVRDDASRPEVLEPLERVSLVYFSGGNPWYLAETLRDTPTWSTIARRLDEGLAFAGCSAGAAFLTERTFDSAEERVERVFKPGIGYARPGVLVGPHWNVVDDWMPGARELIASSVPADGILLGIEEDTGIVGDGEDWSVVGHHDVHVLRGGRWRRAGAGDLLDLPLFSPPSGG